MTEQERGRDARRAKEATAIRTRRCSFASETWRVKENRERLEGEKECLCVFVIARGY